MIRTENLSVGYHHGRSTRTLLANTQVELQPGLTALLGGNGRGKSTLMRTLAGLQAPLSGRVLINNKDVTSIEPRKLARLLAIVTGTASGAAGYTVEELVALGRYPYTGFFGTKSSADRQAVERAMEITGVTKMRHRHVGSLSDGERQKAMIAKALAQETPTILLDEPTAYLDVAARLELLDILAKIARTENRSILLSTHDIAPTLPVADALWLMTPDAEGDAESILITGTPDQLSKSGALDRLFPGSPVAFDTDKGDYILAHN